MIISINILFTLKYFIFIVKVGTYTHLKVTRIREALPRIHLPFAITINVDKGTIYLSRYALMPCISKLPKAH